MRVVAPRSGGGTGTTSWCGRDDASLLSVIPLAQQSVVGIVPVA